MANGGKRKGAGRPKGSTSANTYRFSDYVTEKDRKTFVEFVMGTYMADMRLATWAGDHLFMKPRQDVDITTNGKDLPTPILNALPSNHSGQ